MPSCKVVTDKLIPNTVRTREAVFVLLPTRQDLTQGNSIVVVREEEVAYEPRLVLFWTMLIIGSESAM